MIAISGPCGHRDPNSASRDIKLNYVGPDFGDIRRWRCYFENTSGSSRAIRSAVLCTSAPSSVISVSAVPSNSGGQIEGLPPNAELKILHDPSGAVGERWSAPLKEKLKAVLNER